MSAPNKLRAELLMFIPLVLAKKVSECKTIAVLTEYAGLPLSFWFVDNSGCGLTDRRLITITCKFVQNNLGRIRHFHVEGVDKAPLNFVGVEAFCGWLVRFTSIAKLWRLEPESTPERLHAYLNATVKLLSPREMANRAYSNSFRTVQYIKAHSHECPQVIQSILTVYIKLVDNMVANSSKVLTCNEYHPDAVASVATMLAELFVAESVVTRS